MPRNEKRVNPYTQIAALHNQGIDFVFRKLKDRQAYNEDIKFETILDIVSEYLAKIQNNESPTNIAGNYAILANLFSMDRDKIIEEMLLRREVPKKVIEYLDIVRHIDASAHPEEILKALSDIERELLDSDFTNDEIKYVLLYIAIAKGSLKDWQQTAHLQFPQSHGSNAWPWKEDAESALQAALIGPIDFFLTGGVLTVVSVVGGSVVASSWAAVKNSKR